MTKIIFLLKDNSAILYERNNGCEFSIELWISVENCSK